MQGVSVRVFVGNRQFGATFCTTGGKHSAAIGGSHTFTKTVFVLSLAIRGLKCPFHLLLFLYY
jgi:hypothetical protein